MPQPPLQDLTNNVDYTALSSISGSEINSGFNTLQGNSNASGSIGLLVVTYDMALNTPLVPDPTQVGYSKWENYGWLRIPYSGASDTSGTLYTWNTHVASDPTYLKWVTTKVNVSTILSDITAIQTSVTNANNTANSAAATANTANANATAASAAATSASNAATAAATTANTALASATTANNTANNVAATAASAVATANTALATANTALTTVSAVFSYTGIALTNGYQYQTYPHGLARTPSYVAAKLVCKTAELGYNVGDELDISVATVNDGGYVHQAFSAGANAADVFITQASAAGTGLINILNKNSGNNVAFTFTNWTITIYARL